MKDSDWTDVGDLIDRWSKRFPEDMELNMQWVKQAKEDLKDQEFGENSTGSMRLGTLVHPSLLTYIEHFYPNVFATNRDVKVFAEKFSKFAIPRKY